jgi:hypothetical protein
MLACVNTTQPDSVAWARWSSRLLADERPQVKWIAQQETHDAIESASGLLVAFS